MILNHKASTKTKLTLVFYGIKIDNNCLKSNIYINYINNE